MSAGAHAVLAPQHSAQVSMHMGLIQGQLSPLWKKHNSGKASIFGDLSDTPLIKHSSPLEGHICVIIQQ